MSSGRLRDLVDQVTTKAHGRKSAKFPYVGLENIEPGGRTLTGTAPSSVSESTNGVFENGDILFGKLRPNLRKAVQVDFGGYCSTDLLVLRPRSGVDVRYAGHVSASEPVFRHAERNSIGTGMPRTSWHAVCQAPAWVPSLEEQRRIAEILDTIDETIQASGRVIEKLREVKNGLLLNVLDTYFPGSGPLSLRASRSAGECVVLSALLESREIELGRGKVISTIDIADDPGPHPIYSSSASATGEFGRYGKFMFDEELITWSVDGGGRPFYRPRHRFSVTNVGGFLRIRASQHWSYRFVHALMEVQHAQLTFDWLTKAHPSVIRDLYWFPRIPLSEQHQITKRLAAADVSVQQEKAEMVKLSRLRAGIAADLLSGRVRTVAA